jgi:hypothetical protein
MLVDTFQAAYRRLKYCHYPFKEMETQWMESPLHHPSHISPKSCSANEERSPLLLFMSTKKVTLQMGSAPYVAHLLIGFQHLASFSPYM